MNRRIAVRFDNFPQNALFRACDWWYPIISLVLIRTRPILLLSCHFLGQRALLFWLFTAISSPDVSRSHASRSRSRRMSRPVGRTRDPRRPLVRGMSCLVVAPRRREGVDSPTLGEFCGSLRGHWRYRPRRRPCLTHFAPSSVILVVPDGIDSLRNDQTRPPLIGCIRFHRFRRG